MPNENEQQERGWGGGVIGNAIKLASPMYAWSSLNMIKHMPTQGLRVPWTKFTPWRPSREAARYSEWMASRGISKLSGSMARIEAGMIRRGATKAAAGVAMKGIAARYLVSAAASSALTAIGWLDAITIPAMIGIGAYNFVSSKVTEYKGLELGGYFPDSQAAATSRQRAVQAITSSQLQARSAIGNEAMLFHR